MKKWTKKFLTREYDPNQTSSLKKLKENAENAEKKIGIPKELWMEFSDAVFKFNLMSEINKIENKNVRTEMAFFSGLAIGWAEKNNKIK